MAGVVGAPRGNRATSRDRWDVRDPFDPLGGGLSGAHGTVPAVRPRRPAWSGTLCHRHGRNPVNKAELVSAIARSEEHTSELQSRQYLVCRLLLEKQHAHERSARGET